MKIRLALLCAVCCMGIGVPSVHGGSTYYVWTNSLSDGPGTGWANAFHTIQGAVDAASAGDEVLVTDGVYETGTRVTPRYAALNRVVITKNITVRSVNGPDVTIIRGQGPRGEDAVRCVYMSAGTLTGFTLTNGHTLTSGNSGYDRSGGGLNAYGGSVVVVSNCKLSGNSADDGGGASYATLSNCTLSGNAARDGGGAYCAMLYHCTLTGNSASNSGGGVDGRTLYNCIVYYNSAPTGPNVHESTCRYTCSTPLQAGEGNIDAAPLLASSSHIAADSPCVAAGSSSYASGTDIDGEPWRDPPSMGCDESWPGSATGALEVAIQPEDTLVAQGAPLSFTASIRGQVTSNLWDFGDGHLEGNVVYASHSWAEPGQYDVTLTAYNDAHPVGVAAKVAVTVLGDTYVWQDSPTPAYPYESWSNAAHTIQEAVDATPLQFSVFVTNGVYETGTWATPGYTLLNRVVITNNITVRSVNGPEVTSIRGQGPLGNSAVRCVYMSAGTLTGFTLTNGHTRTSGDSRYDRSGGGLNARGGSGVVSKCVLSGNLAHYGGGGARDATLHNCTLTGNSASYGGGAYGGTLYHCTLSDNSASYGGGTYFGALYHGIVYYNSAPTGPNVYGSTCRYTCATPLPEREGNIADAPEFVNVAGRNFRLLQTSPCIDAGSNALMPFGPDLDGIPRPLDGNDDGLAVVDMGAYEFVHPTADTDGDGMSDAKEFIADTDPTDPQSSLEITDIRVSEGEVTVSWQGGTGATQVLESLSSLTAPPAPWKAVFTNTPPTPSPSVFTDSALTNDTGFYRIRIDF